MGFSFVWKCAMEFVDFSSLKIPKSVLFHKIIYNESKIEATVHKLEEDFGIDKDILEDLAEFINKYYFQVNTSDFMRNKTRIEYLVFIEDKSNLNLFNSMKSLKGSRDKFDIFYKILGDGNILCAVRSLKIGI